MMIVEYDDGRGYTKGGAFVKPFFAKKSISGKYMKSGFFIYFPDKGKQLKSGTGNNRARSKINNRARSKNTIS